jgi:hypothetical protein
LTEKRNLCEQRRREAQSQSRQAAAHHLTVEISLHTADMQDINAHVKDLQRQIYFLSIERNRKRKVVKKLNDEIIQDKKRHNLEKQIATKVKEGGLLNALKTLNQIQAKEMGSSIGYQHETSMSPSKTAQGISSDAENKESFLSFIENFESNALKEQQSVSNVKFTDQNYNDNNRSSIPTRIGEDGMTILNPKQIKSMAVSALKGHQAGRGATPDISGAYGSDSVISGKNSMEILDEHNIQIQHPSLELDSVSGTDTGTGTGLGKNVNVNVNVNVVEAAKNITEDLPITKNGNIAGSGLSLARARKERLTKIAGGYDKISKDDFDSIQYDILYEAKEKYLLGSYDEVKDLLSDILNPNESGNGVSIDKSKISILIESRYLLAETNRSISKYTDSESLYLRCISDLEDPKFMKYAQIPNRSLLTLQVLTSLADYYRNISSLEECREMLYKAKKVSKLLNSSISSNDVGGSIASGPSASASGDGDGDGDGDDDDDAPTAMTSMNDESILAKAEYNTAQGGYYLAIGDYKISELYYKRGLDYRRKVLGLDHCKVASSLSHLGKLAMLQCDYPKASRLIGESLIMRESYFSTKSGNSHPSIGSSLYLKAILLLKLGQYKESGNLMSKSLSIRRVCLPMKHPSIAQSLNGLGELTSVIGYPLKAQYNLDESFRIKLKSYPDGSSMENHYSIIQSLFALGKM